MSVSGCKEEKLTLAGESLTFVEGQEATKSLAVKSGTAEERQPGRGGRGIVGQRGRDSHQGEGIV